MRNDTPCVSAPRGLGRYLVAVAVDSASPANFTVLAGTVFPLAFVGIIDLRHHLRPQPRRRRQHAVVRHQVLPRPRDCP